MLKEIAAIQELNILQNQNVALFGITLEEENRNSPPADPLTQDDESPFARGGLKQPAQVSQTKPSRTSDFNLNKARQPNTCGKPSGNAAATISSSYSKIDDPQRRITRGCMSITVVINA